jgi:hypothetical protein
MIIEFEGQQKALEYISRNMNFTSFREMAIKQAMKKLDYQLVIMLALEGILF